MPARRLLRLLLPLLLLLWALPARSARREAVPSEPPTIVQQALSLEPGDRREALAVLEDYLADHDSGPLVPWVALYAGEFRRLGGDLSVARRYFQRVRDDYPDSPLAGAASLGLALVDGGDHPSGNQAATLALYQDGSQHVPDSLDADRHRVLALLALSRGSLEDARREAKRALEAARRAGDPDLLARVRALASGLPEATRASPAAAGDTAEPAEPGALLDEAQSALLADDFGRARSLARAFLAAHPDDPRADEARYLLRRAEHGDPQHVRKLGVLLPLSGTYAPPGRRLRDAIQLAVAQDGSPVQLVIRDTAGDPEKAVQELESLVLEEGVGAVLGPLLKETAVPVSRAAQALQVPLVALSQKPGLTAAGDYVFQAFLTPAQQVSALLDAAQARGVHRAAIMAPDNPYGHLLARLFQQELEQRGGEVPVQRFYDPSKGDFREDARELGRKDYRARAAEFARLKREAEEKHMDPDKVVLPPVVDYEAIFIPDGYHRVALVASALAYEEFALGRFKPRKTDTPLLVLGTNGWHDDALCLEGGDYVRDGLFVDAFDARDPTPAVQAFVSLYRERFHREPTVLDAMAWDAARLVDRAVQAGPTDRPSLREALLDAAPPDPVSHATSFGPDRVLRRDLLLLRVGKERIELVQEEPGEQ